MSRARSWCFTINNYTDDDVDTLLTMPNEYLVFGFEEGDKCKTPHIQGYVHFDSPKRRSEVAKYIPRGHLQVARGSAEQNFVYCSKDDNYFEFGVKPKQGKRVDIIKIKNMIVEGHSMEHIMTEHPLEYVRYFKGLERMRNMVNKWDNRGREIIYVKPNELDHHMEDTFYCNTPTALNHFDNEDTLVLYNTKAFNTYDLELFIKGHPLYTANKVINPQKVIIVKND